MIQMFLQKIKEVFGNTTPLPIAFGYSHVPATEIKKVPRCMIGAIRKVCNGEALTLSVDNVQCGGGGEAYIRLLHLCKTEYPHLYLKRNTISRLRNK